MPVSEESVLEPKDPSIEDWDDWPTYSLKNIKVFDPLSALPVSLFTAHKSHPVTVIGHLETIEDDQSHLSNNSSLKSCYSLIDVFLKSATLNTNQRPSRSRT